MRPVKLFTIAYLLLSIPVLAQLPDRAQNSFKRALQYRLKKENDKACKQMQEAINADPGYADAYSILGEWYFNERKYKEAAEVFQRAMTAIPKGNERFANPLARSYMYSYNPSAALQVIGAKSKEFSLLQQQAQFMNKAMAERWQEVPTNMGTSINTKYAEMFPGISTDTQIIYFTRRANGIDEDFYQSTVDSCGGWFYARNMGSPPNTSSHESAQMISADDHYLFFGRCDNRSENGWDKGGCDLYMAYRADSVWSVPQSFGATINTPAYEGMPCLSPDNRELYFVSDRPDGYGGLDIWVSRFEDGRWQLPRNLGPEINTKEDETAPFLHIDNSTLYFSSKGHVGMGDADLFYCRRINDSTWTKAVNMGYPINTTANEAGINITVDGSKAYIASDRDSIAGNLDIYEMILPAALQPVKVAVLKGYSFDSMSKEKLNYSSIYISDANTGEQLYHFVSNRGDGSYMITVPVGKNYVYNADRIGYLDITDTLRLKDIDTMVSMDFNIPLLPQGYVAPVHDTTALTIYFPRNSYQLSDSTKQVLQQAIGPWMGQRNTMILVHGYTDNTGTPMINETLSYTRADIVANELSNMGVDPSYISRQGWGEANPIATNDDEEGRTLNRRVEVIIRR